MKKTITNFYCKILLTCFSCILLFSTELSAQKVTLNVSQESLSSVIQKIQSQTP